MRSSRLINEPKTLEAENPIKVCDLLQDSNSEKEENNHEAENLKIVNQIENSGWDNDSKWKMERGKIMAL
jgi:hypothetical protein